MAVAGIVAEFDPFHLGHLYLIDAVRRRLGAGTPVVAALSGLSLIHISIDAKVWHFVPFPLGRKTMCAVVFANGTSSNDIYFKDLPEALGLEL